MRKRVFAEEEKKLIIDFYLTPHSLLETAAEFQLKSVVPIKRILLENDIPLRSKEMSVAMQQERAKKTFKAIYWLDFAIASKTVRDRAKASCSAKYGFENPFQAENVKRKAKSTMKKKYGVEHALQNDGLKRKMRQTTHDRYGADWYNKSDIAKSNAQMKYGADFYMKTNEFKEKRIASLKANKTFNSSRAEDAFYGRLSQIFPDAVRQYSDDRYRFSCDFYIPAKDLFTELNLSWTHGGHPFDRSSEADAQKLAAWKEKTKSSKYYANAINTWTNRDVEKLAEARRNALNYIVLYSKSDCDAFLKSYIK